MNIREISKPVTAKSLNESLAKRFGKRIALEKFTLEQLEDARNKLRTQLSQVETNESFDAVSTNKTYQKNKLFLDVLNAEIVERTTIGERITINKDGTKSQSAAQQLANKWKTNQDDEEEEMQGDIDESTCTDCGKSPCRCKKESIVREGAEDQAELVMAAKDMVDRVTGWMEDTAEMQTESMLELADAIRDEMGQVQSEQFVSTVKPALEGLYTAMESTRSALTQGVGMLTGEAEPVDTMGAEEEPAMEPTVDQEAGTEINTDDGLGASAPATGGEEPAGRARRESKEYSKKKIAERSQRLGSILSKKKT